MSFRQWQREIISKKLLLTQEKKGFPLAIRAFFFFVLIGLNFGANCSFFLDKAYLYKDDFPIAEHAIKQGRDCSKNASTSSCASLGWILAQSLTMLYEKKYQNAVDALNLVYELGQIPDSDCLADFLNRVRRYSLFLEQRNQKQWAASLHRVGISYLLMLKSEDENLVNSELESTLNLSLVELAQQYQDSNDANGAKLILDDLPKDHPGALWLTGMRELKSGEFAPGLLKIYRAAREGQPRACTYLSGLYFHEKSAKALGLRPSLSRSHYWMNAAAKHEKAYKRLLKSLEVKMNPDDILESNYWQKEEIVPDLYELGIR